ncbi:unnamed protein product [Aphis gossypii]|uniref:RNA-directed DNA polymerase n=1 Tax=Aphis gossypii TaxID=80765 RepID=A0A9P0J9I9_APHGO|nr:unnamed protein product [Aphis gossypii]
MEWNTYSKLGAPPLFARPRRLPPDRLNIARCDFDRMQKQGICRPSSSSWASPLLLVPKKDGSYRPCGDYRRLNSVTIPDRYPLPYLHDFTANLAKKTIFTKLDLVRAYNQVPIAAGDVHKTAVTTPFGLFEFPVMSFGLRNAAQTFQRLINSILTGFDFVFAYVDDVLIASVNAEQHVEHVRAVLGRFEEFGIAINPGKCVFAASTLTFLGHVVDAQGLRPNPDSAAAIRQWPQPQTKKELQRFLGSLNFYHRFVAGAAKLQAALYDIAAAVKGRDGPLSWNDAAEESFRLCREALADTTRLVHPRSDAPLRLSTDASNIAVGAVLEQCVEGNWQPLGFFSRKLSGAQTRYSTYDRELLAAYLATRHFVHSIEGRPTTLRTDHRPLLFMFSQKTEKLVDRQARHIAFLSQYFDEIEHVSGERNTIPDALSRLELAIFDHGLPDLNQWAIDQANDMELQDIITGKTESSLELDARQTTNGPVYFDIAHNRSRLLVPRKHRRAVFTTLHQQAHGGSAATARIVKDRFVWPGMDREIRRWVKMCQQCQKAKVHKHTTTPLASFASPDRRFGHIHLDLVGPLPPSNGAKYLLTCVDRFTRWPEAWPVDNMSAHTVAAALVSNWISRFGVPDVITTDQGRQFESELMRALNTAFGIQHVRTSPYHPQANGMVERFHRTLKAALTAHESPHWSLHLPVVLLALRNTIKPDTGSTPAELVYGTSLRLPGELFHAAPPEARTHDFVTTLKASMANLRLSPGANHDPARRVFIPTQMDTVSHVFVRIDAQRTPLQPRYEGPYAVLQRRDKVFKLQLDNRTAWISVDRLKPAFVLRDDPIVDHSYARQPIDGLSTSTTGTIVSFGGGE